MSLRINKFVAQATGLSRRRADQLVIEGRISLNGQPAKLGDIVSQKDRVSLDGQSINLARTLTVMLNKPVGYVCSRKGQGSQTIYELLPNTYSALKTVGRLDKDSSGLVLLTNDGRLSLSLTHPRYHKEKLYNVTLNKALMPGDFKQITISGVKLSDGLSKFSLRRQEDKSWQVIMHEGRNRQIRRTFEALGYQVKRLHRLQIGQYRLDDLKSGQYKEL